MDYNYLRIKFQTFRRENFDLSKKWMKKSGSWLWNFSIDNCKYLYLGEINQINFLSNIVKQQKEYIDLIQSNPIAINNEEIKKYTNDVTLSEKLLKITFIAIILPLGFLIYWIRRIYRIILRKNFKLMVSDVSPTEDMKLNTEIQGRGRSVYLLPIDTQRFPKGLVIFNYSLMIDDINIEPLLYIDPGVGFSSEYTIPLPHNHEMAAQEFLLEIPPHCKQLQLGFASEDINYHIKDASIMETSIFHAARYLKIKYNYGLNEILHALFIRKLPGVRRTRADKYSYPVWHSAYSKLSSNDKKAIKQHIGSLNDTPLFSIVINIDNAHPEFLELCFKSLITQLYPNWELLITCNQFPDANITFLLNKYESNDERMRIIIDEKNACITANISDALVQAKGHFTVFLEYPDLLTEHALYLFASHVHNKSNVKLVYSDYDHITPYGALLEPHFKPDWNYDFFLGKNYLQYLVCYQTDYLNIILDIEKTNPFTQSSQLNILMVEKLDSTEILHIPYILLHHRQMKTKLDTDPEHEHEHEQQHDLDALNAHLLRTNQAATVIPVKAGYWIKRNLPNPQPLISLIVLTRDRVALLSHCIHGLLEKTAYKNIEIIIVDNGSKEDNTLTYLDSISRNPRVKVIKHPAEFNFSELNNIAIDHVNGDFIGLINNDISVIEPHWLDEMMGHLIREEVGIVGAKLLYEDNTIQHAGVIIGLGGVAGHNFRYQPRNARGYDDRLALCQEMSCVTAACLITKKDIYVKVGGLDATNVRIAFNDVDFCLKVRELGYKIIWTPFAELYHLESASRGSDLSEENIHRWNSEYTFMRGKWRPVLEQDPFYNPNLTIADEDFSLAIPPRLIHPWERYRYIKPNDDIPHLKTV